MSHLSKALAILTMVLLMAGCGLHQHSHQLSLAEYPYRYADFDYKYAWNTTATDEGTLISGVIKNVRYAYIDSVVMKIALLDKEGKKVAEASGFPMPQQSREGDTCHFSILLAQSKPVRGDIFQFQIQYTGNEGGNQSGVNWYSSFKADAVTGTAVRPSGRNPDQW